MIWMASAASKGIDDSDDNESDDDAIPPLITPCVRQGASSFVPEYDRYSDSDSDEEICDIVGTKSEIRNICLCLFSYGRIFILTLHSLSFVPEPHANMASTKARPAAKAESPTSEGTGNADDFMPHLTTPSRSKKPRDRMLHNHVYRNEGKIIIECLKCPRNVAKPPFKKEWKSFNATLLRDRLTRNCAGVDLDLQMQLLESEFSK